VIGRESDSICNLGVGREVRKTHAHIIMQPPGAHCAGKKIHTSFCSSSLRDPPTIMSPVLGLSAYKQGANQYHKISRADGALSPCQGFSFWVVFCPHLGSA
jgi:hypothetical protein